jgi:L-iditol 2-dehydrogenase
MKVAVYHNNNDIRIKDVETPKISEGEILIKVMASGICGTDVMEWYRIKKGPRILGHEIAGEVVESKSKRFKTRDRVFVSHHVPCDDCKYCREGDHTACETLHTGNYDPGGFSEYVRIPEINVEKGTYVLGELSYEEGTMVEPLGCCVRGLRVIGVESHHTVLILGAGVSGLMNIQLAKLIGAKVITTDIKDYRLSKAREYGADEVIDAREDFSVDADRIIMCTGAGEAAKKAFQCVDRKGIILFFAIPSEDICIPIPDFWRNELTVTSSYGAAPVDLEEAIELMQSGKINVADMITHKFPLEDIQQAFKVAANADESLKVVVLPFGSGYL